MRRLFHAVVVAGCALPAACARIEEEPRQPVDSGAIDTSVATDTAPQFELDTSAPIEDTALADVGDTPHPSITK